MKFIDRQLTTKIQVLSSQYPILTITGPRQSGKSTLLKKAFSDYRYISFENPDIRSFANDDPIGFLKKYDKYIIFDEVQRVPGIFSYLQTIVDESGLMGQFILSGSQNFQLLENISQSLAGRSAIFKLLPFDSIELSQAGLLPSDWKSLIIKGFYPAIHSRNLDPSIYYSNYLQTYVERDVAELTNVQDKQRFRNFLALCATKNSQLVNFSDLAKDAGISHTTARSWLSILESSYIVFLLPPYFENFSKRIIKSPKLYFYDTGLLSFLLGYRSIDDIDESTIIGSLFENLVISNIFKVNHHQYLLRNYWFWRDSNGYEVDLITKKGGGFDIYEVKSTQTVLPKLFKGMDYFTEITKGQVKSRTLFYGGDENQDKTKYRVRRWNEI